jgi:carbon-monoxide dehydrogenase iron sulfur subunit
MCAMICPYGVIGRQKEARVAVKCDRCKDLNEPAWVVPVPLELSYLPPRVNLWK